MKLLYRPVQAGALLFVGTLLAGCGAKKEATPMVGTAVVDRRTIVVDAQSTGAVEPINVIEVKSKASGQITKMPVETGYLVKQGQLLVQIDTRDVRNQYDQAVADARSARASLDVALAQKTRSDELFKTRIITTQEFENSQLAHTQAQGAVVRANTNLDLAKQRMEDATVVAPVDGTVIEKPVALGQVIASATGSVSGGTILLKMADLSKVRVRALVNETDIGKVRAGQPARVTVDAYPDRPFQGIVEKIEPQAVVQQSVTMFPVIVSLDNSEGFLKPGMNGEVSMLIDRRENVVAVSNDAVRTLREASTAAALVGLNPDSVAAKVRELQAAMRAGGGAGQPASDAPPSQSVAMGAGGGNSGAGNAGGGTSAAAGAGSGEAGARRRTRGAGGDSAARGAGGGEMRPRSARGGSAGGSGGTRDVGGSMRAGGARTGGNAAGAMSGGSAGGSMTGGAANGTLNGGARAPSVIRPRSGLVFVKAADGKFEPRLVSLGASNYDYSEVLSGLKEGDTVATLAVAALQARRDQQNDRMRQSTTVPGVQRAPAGGAPAGGGPGGGGGGRPPGGGR
ncbi:MAG: efflux RND transporter periplasmic adaptor subunit [Gemmatimonas sp.]